MSFYECPKCGGIPGVTFCCTSIDKKKESKVTMPEPEAFLYLNGEHRCVSLNLRGDMDLSEGTVRYTLITTDQAEAYAAAKAREALEEAAALCDRFAERDMHPEECAGAIRALIPKEQA